MIGLISRTALAAVGGRLSSSRHAANALRLIHSFTFLHFAGVLNDLFQSIFGVDAFPITANSPNGSVNERRIALSQHARAICLHLVAHLFTGMLGRGNNDVDMIGSGIGSPKMPSAKIAESTNFRFDEQALLNGQ